MVFRELYGAHFLVYRIGFGMVFGGIVLLEFVCSKCLASSCYAPISLCSHTEPPPHSPMSSVSSCRVVCDVVGFMIVVVVVLGCGQLLYTIVHCMT